MSLVNLLQPNSYVLYAKDIISSQGISAEEFSAYLPSDQLLSLVVFTPIVMSGTLISSPHYNTTTGEYTIPRNGNYLFEVSVGLIFTISTAGNSTFSINLLSNGSPVRSVNFQSEFSTAAGPTFAPYHENVRIQLLSTFNEGDVLSVGSQPVTGAINVQSGTYMASTLDTYWSVIEH